MIKEFLFDVNELSCNSNKIGNIMEITIIFQMFYVHYI